MKRAVLLTASILVVLALQAGPPAVLAHKEPLVVSVWGGNWKDTVEKIVGKAFTAKTGMNDDARAKTLAAWKERFNANIVAK